MQNVRMEISSRTNSVWGGFEHGVTTAGGGARLQLQPEDSCSWCQLSFGPRFSTQQGAALWWGQRSGALRHQHHEKKSINRHDEQTLLFPPKIYAVSSASQRAVVSSDGQLGRITSIC